MHDSDLRHLDGETSMDRLRLHPLDYEDVSISLPGLKLVRHAARSLMRRHMPGSDPESLTIPQAMALFVDHLFWEEGTGGLVLCMRIAAKAFCLPIPKNHWGLRQSGDPVH